MKIYKVYRGDCLVETFTESGFKEWVKENAKKNYGVFRIIGDKNSNEFGIDFDRMYQVKVDIE